MDQCCDSICGICDTWEPSYEFEPESDHDEPDPYGWDYEPYPEFDG